jgi:hypothetical protein
MTSFPSTHKVVYIVIDHDHHRCDIFEVYHTEESAMERVHERGDALLSQGIRPTDEQVGDYALFRNDGEYVCYVAAPLKD